MYKALDGDVNERVRITVDGKATWVQPGVNLAAALLQEGLTPFRETPTRSSPRQPYCMMGVCFDCIAIVDGVQNQQTCLETVRPGMVIQRQLGSRSADNRE